MLSNGLTGFPSLETHPYNGVTMFLFLGAATVMGSSSSRMSCLVLLTRVPEVNTSEPKHVTKVFEAILN